MSHPAVMFEIMANDQHKIIDFYTNVFGWQTELKNGFAYIQFPPAVYHLLGGIGQAKPGEVGQEKGVTFYIQVENLEDTLDQVVKHGGKKAVEPVTVDGYHFAMFYDPEQNLIGVIEPFDTSSSIS